MPGAPQLRKEDFSGGEGEKEEGPPKKLGACKAGCHGSRTTCHGQFAGAISPRPTQCDQFATGQFNVVFIVSVTCNIVDHVFIDIIITLVFLD